MKQAVILAAGRGSRLNGASNALPKCLLEVGGAMLIEHQLRTLEVAGIEQVCAVVGYRAAEVRSIVGNRCEVITNNRYWETNSLHSLWSVREWVTGPFVLLNSDVLAHPDVYHRVLAVDGSSLAYDSSSGQEPEHMKVSLDGHLVRAISKTLPPEQVHGENVGILQFDTQGADLLLGEADRLVRQGDLKAWAPAAVHHAAQTTSIRAVDVSDLPWTEIDFPEDLSGARHRVWPLIELGRWVADSTDTEPPLVETRRGSALPTPRATSSTRRRGG